MTTPTATKPHAPLRVGEDIVLRVDDVTVEFSIQGGQVLQAVSGVSIDLARGETLGLVGESGCGKSTLTRAILRLQRVKSGTVTFDGTDLTDLDEPRMRRLRPRLQVVFQDPISALNPRRKVKDIVAEPLSIWRRGRGSDALGKDATRALVEEVLTSVGLDPLVVAERRPHEFSGGQCQRISIARALVLEPEVLICDEPVSALDVSVQAEILNLLEDMKERYGLTMVFVSHDLAVVKSISDRVAVMYLGKIVEVGPAEAVFAGPGHHYTAGLLASIPRPEARGGAGRPLTGELPSPLDPPTGCRFRTRCPRAQELCTQVEPLLHQRGEGHFVACHFPIDRDSGAAPRHTGQTGDISQGGTS